MKRLLTVIAALALVFGACGTGAAPTAWPAATASSAPSTPPTGTPATSTTPSASAAAVEITVRTDTGTELKFDPPEVDVPAGAHVRLVFDNRATVPHNLTFGDPINMATATIVAPGTSSAIEFVAPATGSYKFMCTLHPGMSGALRTSSPADSERVPSSTELGTPVHC